MHAEPTHCPTLDAVTTYERIAILVLLDSDHGPWSREELERELLRKRDDRANVSSAIDNLHAVGLVHLSGALVFPTRAARAMDELHPICI